MPTLLTVKHHFSAGHRIPGLEGAGAKCSHIHGHTFGVEWTFMVDAHDAGEFEFAEAKKVLRGWVDANLDHGFLVSPHDDQMLYILRGHAQKHYVVEPVPTTEAIAAMLLRQARCTEDFGKMCVQVKVTEGPNNEAVVVI